MRIWGVNFRSPAALNKAATTALNKDKAVRVHKEGVTIANHCAIANLLRIVNLLPHSIFSAWGPSGTQEGCGEKSRSRRRGRFSSTARDFAKGVAGTV